MNRNHRAHLQSAVYMILSIVALAAGWTVPVGLPSWENVGLQPNLWWNLGALAVMGAALLLKVSRPSSALILGALAVLVEASFALNLGILICLTDLIYNHGIRAAARRTKAGGVTLLGIAVALTVAAAAYGGGTAALNTVVLSAAILLVPLWWSHEVRRGYPAFVEDAVRRRLEQEQHADLLAEQRSRRRAAVESERRRMARELHDVVSSQVASIALTSGAVLSTEPESDRDRGALQTIRTTSVDALNQLRHMVQVLRSQGPDDAAELLTNTTWEEVLRRAEAQGLRIAVSGSPPETLTEAVRGMLLRILQEALTNALKHGDATAVVLVETEVGRLRLRVDSGLAQTGGAPPPEAEPDLQAGTGLVVMDERAQAVGGTLEAGTQRGLWRVEANLPYQEVHDEPLG